MKHLYSFLLVSLICISADNLFAQKTLPVAAPSDARSAAYAFTNATIYTDYKTRTEKATLLIREGKVVACGTNVSIPAGTVVQDCSGKTIYPAFIDLYATGYGLPAPPTGGPTGGGGGFGQRQTESSKKGAFAWNEALRSEYNLADAFANDPKAAEEWRKAGFAAVLSHRADGISRGTGALVHLSDNKEHETLLMAQAAHFLSFRKGNSTQSYPTSLMGCIALLRQTYFDGQWYKNGGQAEERNRSLDAWNALQGLPQIFEATDKLDVLRIASLGKEFGIKYIVKTAGDEYQRLNEVTATGMPLIVPLNYPEGYDVRDPYDAMAVTLKDLKHWEMAASNPARLQNANIPFSLTTNGLKEKNKFLENLRKAIEMGLTEENALKALTFNPASFINAYSSLGSLEAGKWANFIITTGNVFKAESKIMQTWSQGRFFDISPDKAMLQNMMGIYDLSVGSDTYTLTLKGKAEAPEAQIMRKDSMKIKGNLSWNPNGLVTLSFQPDSIKKGTVALSGTTGGNEWAGRGTLPDGTWVNWRANLTKQNPASDKPARTTTPDNKIGEVIYPFTAFGRKDRPQAQTILVKNATIWTNERDGILTNSDVLISKGKIAKIGKNLPQQDDAIVIDGTNKHLTAGIIDEHSHIAASRSINEFGQESSAEVRIADVLDSEDIDIYRQLAGGVTSSHILHGSANPIGGQTQLIKMRWGYAPEELKFANWPGYIKFALGENVKQSGSQNATRYPQTRMGVEQTYLDYFNRAREYTKVKSSGKPYRIDLELEALAEILASKRFITCHSYVQSEITMMIRVAEQFGFKLNTFTHILEGYKIADKMAKHGAGGSSFADWWAYKMEVYEAIPQNPKLMADNGVVVAINSDDAEMARRLNQEAAKSVMYAGMKEEEAWKMVTLNPAKLLRVDDRVGSIKVGKDADVVLWNAHPLSVYAAADKTWVDGTLFFDRAEDVKMSNELRTERARIIQKMQLAKKGGEGGERPTMPKHHYHCDDAEDEGN